MSWKNMFRFAPRAGREEFAAVGLFCNLVTYGNLLFSVWSEQAGFLQERAMLISLPVSVLAFWLGLALYSRRLHDFGLSLWWYILYAVVTFGLSILSPLVAAVISILGIFVWAFLALKTAPQTPNRFGEEMLPFLPFFEKPFVFYFTAGLGILAGIVIAVTSMYWSGILS